MQRRLAAILSADIVGYSGLMEADEAGTLERLQENRRVVFDPCVARHGGRLVKLMGDGALVEFASVVAAVQCAIAIQSAMAGAEPDLEPEQRLRYRIGVNVGDVIVEGEDIYGEGVNVAARLQAFAPPGGIAVPSQVREQVEGKAAASFEDAGEHALKNIHRPVHIFLARPGQVSPARSAVRRVLDDRRSIAAAVAVAATLALLIFLLARPAPTVAQPALLAVLPFDNLSTSPDTGYFADGLSEEIINELLRLRTVPVVSRTSSFQIRGAEKASAAKALRATHILDGSVRREGDRVRVTTQLVDARSSRALWSHSYDREIAQVLPLQRDIAGAIAAALELRIEPAHLTQGVSSEAYDRFLRGRDIFRSRAQIHRAIDHLERAVQLSPSFGRAWSTLAATRLLVALGASSEHDEARSKQLAEQAREAANRALALDATDAEALGALALLSERLWDFREAGRYYERAVAAEPNNAQLLNWRSGFLAQVGRVRDSIADLEFAYDRDRLTPVVRWNLALGLYSVGRHEEARSILALHQNMVSDFESKTNFLFVTRRWHDLAEHMKAPPADLERQDYYRLCGETAAALDAGDATALRALMARWRAAAQTAMNAASEVDIAWEEPVGWLVALDDVDGVFESLDHVYSSKARERLAGPTTSLLFDRLFVRIRHDRRFVALMTRWGLFDYWRTSKQWPDFCSEPGLPYDCKVEAQAAINGSPDP